MSERFYPLADTLSDVECRRFECNRAGRRRDGCYVMAVFHENRMGYPRRGGWYLSGAIPEAYRSLGDMTQAQMIARLVLVRDETRTVQVLA